MKPLFNRSIFPIGTRLLALAFAISLASVRAQAASYSFDLHGSVDNGFTETYGSSPNQNELWQLPLNDMPHYIAHAGDMIDATVTLDRSHTIPATASGSYLSVDLVFYGGLYNLAFYGNTETTASFYLNGTPVFSVTDAITTTTYGGALASGILLYPPDNLTITFDQVRFHSAVTQIGPGISSLDLTLAELSTTRTLPVPEPDFPSLFAAALSGLVLARGKMKKT